MNITRIISILIVLTVLAACSKPAETAKQVDESAAGRGAAAVPAASSPAANQEKTNTDLARLRELKEIEEARNKSASQSTKEFADGVQRGAAAPIRQIK
jgi:hypothetical protein